MPSLAIISSYNESCGNASYTHVLKNAFSEHLDVEVIPLDLFVLQKRSAIFRKHADQHIRDICERLKGFDYVNIQFEAGLYGATLADIFKRLRWLVEAAPNLILTMHRVDPRSDTRTGQMLSCIRHRSLERFITFEVRRRYSDLYFKIVDLCKRESQRKNLWICVHTKRERRIVKDIYEFQNVFDYPLAFLSEKERAAVPRTANVSTFKQRYGFPEDAKVIGVFGYISAYKGVETAIKALAHLPDNYHLGIFGTQHPQTIEQNVQIDPYLRSLLKCINKEGESQFKKKFRRLAMAAKADPQLKFKMLDEHSVPTSIDEKLQDVASNPLLKRIHFLGNVSDPAFIEALHVSDAVVLPYLEVGQSMSAVIALAMEAGAKMFCANNLSFLEVKKYYGSVFHTFDIGNHVELAQKIGLGGSNFATERKETLSRYNISGSIRLHLEKFGHKVVTELKEASRAA